MIVDQADLFKYKLSKATALLAQAQECLKELRLEQTGDDVFEYENHSAAPIIDDIEDFLKMAYDLA